MSLSYAMFGFAEPQHVMHKISVWQYPKSERDRIRYFFWYLILLVYWFRFLVLWTNKQSNLQTKMYFTSFRGNRLLFRWYTNLDLWQINCTLHKKWTKNGHGGFSKVTLLIRISLWAINMLIAVVRLITLDHLAIGVTLISMFSSGVSSKCNHQHSSQRNFSCL